MEEQREAEGSERRPGRLEEPGERKDAGGCRRRLEEAGGGWRRLEEAGGGWRRLEGVTRGRAEGGRREAGESRGREKI
jgi:hypothetical protein